MKTSKKIGIAVITIAAVAAFGFRLNHLRTVKEKEGMIVESAMKGIPVRVIKATRSEVTEITEYNGTFEASREVTIVSEAQGKVDDFFIETGDYITKGETMVKVNNDMISYQLEVAEASYKKAVSDLTRFENLLPGEAVSEQQLEEMKLATINTKAAWLTLKRQYENTWIKAPISGTVSKRYVEQGCYLAPGSPVADICDTRKMNFIAWVKAEDLRQIKEGQMVKLVTDYYPGITFEARITVIGVKPDQSRRYMIQAEVDNSHMLPSGIDGSIIIESVSEEKSIVLPRTCVTGNTTDASVFVVDDQIARLRPITISGMTDNEVIIKEGLSEGSYVVISGQINIQDSMKVTVLYN